VVDQPGLIPAGSARRHDGPSVRPGSSGLLPSARSASTRTSARAAVQQESTATDLHARALLSTSMNGLSKLATQIRACFRITLYLVSGRSTVRIRSPAPAQRPCQGNQAHWREPNGDGSPSGRAWPCHALSRVRRCRARRPRAGRLSRSP
jgi:hypothetical protein